MVRPVWLLRFSIYYTYKRNLNFYVVIIFDNRGAGNTTAGTKQFSINQFAKDTAGLLDALKISKADVLGWSMGSYIAQELTLANPG